MGGRKGRDGLFPASDCIKVNNQEMAGLVGRWRVVLLYGCTGCGVGCRAKLI